MEGGFGIPWLSPGTAAGYIHYFLEDFFPNQPGGKRLLHTPSFLSVGVTSLPLHSLRRLPAPWRTWAGLSQLAPPHRKLLLDAPEEDPDYLPFPKEQPAPLQQ